MLLHFRGTGETATNYTLTFFILKFVDTSTFTSCTDSGIFKKFY